MNVLDLLSNELKEKEWSTEEKAYYIYIRSCQIFSYDPRYVFCEFVSNGNVLEAEIKMHKIDLENVQDNRVVCTSHSNVLATLLRELLSIDVIERGNGHSRITFNDKKRKIEADAIYKSDIERVKMGLTTYGYNSIPRDYNFNNKLKEISKKINYIQDEYTDYFLEQRINGIFEEFINYSYPNEVTKDCDEFKLYKLHTVKELFGSFNQLQNFSDAEFCISYLLRKFLKIDNNKVSLFEILDSDSWQFINLYPFKLENDTIYFILEKGKDLFDFYEISHNDVINYIDSMDGYNKQLIYR